MFTDEYKSESNNISKLINGCAIEVHRTLGPGLLESIYEKCLCFELSLNNLQFPSQLHMPVKYKEVVIKPGYRYDVLVENKVIIELKSVETILPIHKAQLKTYLKLSSKCLGLLLNFNVEVMKTGIERIVWG
jgi:GxxExxY protein